MSVVVTGVGTIGPWGIGTSALDEAWRRGELALSEVERGRFHRRSSGRFAAQVDHASYREWLPAAAARRMSGFSRMALAASRIATKEAGLEESDLAGPETAVSVGTSFGSSQFTARLLAQIESDGPEAASPFLFMETVANAAAGQVALFFGAQGANATVTHREASGLAAVARALHLFERGNCERAFAGAADEVSPLVHGGLDGFRALARPDAAGREVARIFDRDRAGIVLAEGATMLVLEREEAARARSAPLRARVRAAVRAHDPTASTWGWGTGSDVLADVLVRGLERHDIAPSSIDRIVSGASGSRDGDRLEGQVLRRVFGAELPPVLTPKAATGEFGGGLLAGAFVALDTDEPGGSPGFQELDPDVDVRPHTGGTLPTATRILVSSLASGGTACWLVLESCR